MKNFSKLISEMLTKTLNENLDNMMNDIKSLSNVGDEPVKINQQQPQNTQKPVKPTSNTSQIRVEKYRNTRFWQVSWGNELIVVTAYLKGANRVAELLKELEIYKNK